MVMITIVFIDFLSYVAKTSHKKINACSISMNKQLIIVVDHKAQKMFFVFFHIILFSPTRY